jgi:TRAP-type C4-dicarboxylate transport system substrate-binding protein
MNTGKFKPFHLLIATTVLAALAIGEAQAQKTTIRVSSFLPARSSSIVGVFNPWLKRLRKEFGDKVSLPTFWGGALGRNPRKQYDLVKDGVTDVGMIVPGYTPGKFPGYSVFELPFMARSAAEGAAAEWRMHAKRPFPGFGNVKLLAMYSTEANNIHTKRPVRSTAGIKGLKIRTAGPVYGATVKHFGGIPIGMPVTQATEALSRGVVDGVMLGIGGATVFRVDAIAKYHLVAPFGVSPLIIIMNKKKWDGLSSRLKAVIDKHSGARLSREGGVSFDRNAKRSRAKWGKAGGHHFVDLSEAELKAGFKAVQPVHQAWIKRTKNGQKIYDAYVKVLADIRAGK